MMMAKRVADQPPSHEPTAPTMVLMVDDILERRKEKKKRENKSKGWKAFILAIWPWSWLLPFFRSKGKARSWIEEAEREKERKREREASIIFFPSLFPKNCHEDGLQKDS